jgi:hypothetical protein
MKTIKNQSDITHEKKEKPICIFTGEARHFLKLGYGSPSINQE